MSPLNAVYEFWIGSSEAQLQPGYLSERMKLWFGKSESIDQKIRQDFAKLMDDDHGARLVASSDVRELLSLVILWDQFPRNAFRETFKSFAYDSRALSTARRALDQLHAMDSLKPWEVLFLLLPFEHSETLADQEEGLRHFARLRSRVDEKWATFVDEVQRYAVRHKDIVARFGRFPHRNEILGRVSTPEELEFLKLPGSRF